MAILDTWKRLYHHLVILVRPSTPPESQGLREEIASRYPRWHAQTPRFRDGEISVEIRRNDMPKTDRDNQTKEIGIRENIPMKK